MRSSSRRRPAIGSPSAEKTAGARTRRRYGSTASPSVRCERFVLAAEEDLAGTRHSVLGPARAIGAEELLEQQLLHVRGRHLAWRNERGIAGDEHGSLRRVVG